MVSRYQKSHGHGSKYDGRGKGRLSFHRSHEPVETNLVLYRLYSLEVLIARLPAWARLLISRVLTSPVSA